MIEVKPCVPDILSVFIIIVHFRVWTYELEYMLPIFKFCLPTMVFIIEYRLCAVIDSRCLSQQCLLRREEGQLVIGSEWPGEGNAAVGEPSRV